VIAPDLRRVRIQNGYGIEKILSNEDTRVIIDNVMMPAFRANNFFNGTKEGLLAIIRKLEQRSR
ncbi:MAG TPA: TPM domain-containing protein, partial [Chitinophagaceae bacterium]|nr:TPM domain-containing protein [Chitinophagaceae bacterium]